MACVVVVVCVVMCVMVSGSVSLLISALLAAGGHLGFTPRNLFKSLHVDCANQLQGQMQEEPLVCRRHCVFRQLGTPALNARRF